jgi:hypothetical protein
VEQRVKIHKLNFTVVDKASCRTRHLNGLDLVRAAPGENGIGLVYQH